MCIGGVMAPSAAVAGDGDVFATVKTIARASLMPAKVRVAVGQGLTLHHFSSSTWALVVG